MDIEYIAEILLQKGVTKRCRLSWLTNSALVYETKCGWRGGVAGSQPMGTSVHRSYDKVWRSNPIFNLFSTSKDKSTNYINDHYLVLRI
jgi:hypothetical protein